MAISTVLNVLVEAGAEFGDYYDEMMQSDMYEGHPHRQEPISRHLFEIMGSGCEHGAGGKTILRVAVENNCVLTVKTLSRREQI